DVDGLDTNGTTLRAIDEDPMSPWTQCVVEGWYNTTDFTGSITPSKRLARFPVIQRVEYSLDQEIGGRNTVRGDTLGYNISSGARATLLYGELDDRYLRTGIDFHFWGQRLRENFDVTNTIPPLSLGRFSTNQPRGRLADEGIFVEYGTPVVDGWNVAIGGRVDFVETRSDPRDIRPDTNLDVDELVQNDTLY